MRGRTALWAAVFVSLLAMPPVARGHLGHVVRHAERYLKIDLRDRTVRVVISLTLSEQEMAHVMAAADEDRDGSVREKEAASYMRRWAVALREELPVRVDGQPVDVQWGDPYFAPTGAVRNVAGSVELIAVFELDGGRHSISIEDRMDLSRFERTDVAFRAGAGGLLIAAGEGAEPAGRRSSLFYGRQPERAPSELTAVFEVPGLSRFMSRFVAAGGAALVVLVGASWWLLRRRRRARPAS